MNNYSLLYSSIARGKWFMDFRQVGFYEDIIDKMVNRKGELSDTTMSEKKPFTVGMAGGKSIANGSKSAVNEGCVALVPLQGAMLKHDTMCSYGTETIAGAIDSMSANNDVVAIVLDIDSGGGSVSSIAPLIAAIQRAQANGKPVIASCDTCCSAAYYVACYCDEIVANNNISSEFGSIGVMMSFVDYSEKYAKDGVKEHVVYSTHSSEKNSAFEDAKKGNYEKIKLQDLDPLAITFREAVKANRPNLKIDQDEAILKGRTYYSPDALNNGLIDSIGSPEVAINRAREISREMIINQYIKK